MLFSSSGIRVTVCVMAPKKKQGGPKGASKAKPHTADGKPAPKLQISSENERRLRRLLLNNERPSSSSEVPAVAAPDVASKYQKAKRLRAVYDKLSLEGFSADQIEIALSALGVRFLFSFYSLFRLLLFCCSSIEMLMVPEFGFVSEVI